MLFLDLANRRNDLIVAQRLHCQVETHLVVAHAGATVRNDARTQFFGTLERSIHDQVAVGHQQWVLALVPLARPHERLDEAVPDRRATVHGDVAGRAQFGGALLDELTLFGIHTTGVGKHGVHRIAPLLQIRNAEAGVQTTGKRENDVLGAGSRDWGFGIGGSDLLRHGGLLGVD
ncbi:hypothetical protein XAUB_08330 [Xanthomonas citri pv. aurantifolii str. ICPB 11122]|nr:hypothetical protein XAUB_08330 [Xanthomonas citri pv. aurantifolii str. ICPB 11122]